MNLFSHDEINLLEVSQQRIAKTQKQEFENFHHIHNQQILLTLLYDEFDIEQFISDGLILEQFPLHDVEEKELIIKFWKNERINILFEPFQLKKSTSRTFCTLSTYFGPEVGMFFVFLFFFSTWLFLPAIPGLILGIIQFFDEEAISAIAPINTLCMAVWATIFLNFGRENKVKLCIILICIWQRNKEEIFHNLKDLLQQKMQHIQQKQWTLEMYNGNTQNLILLQLFQNWSLFLDNRLDIIILNRLIRMMMFIKLYGLVFQHQQFQQEMKFSISFPNTPQFMRIINSKMKEKMFISQKLFYRNIIKPDKDELHLFSISFTIKLFFVHLIRYTIYPWISFIFIKLKFNRDFNKQKQLNNNKQTTIQQKIGDTETSGMNKKFDKGISSSQYFLQQIELNKRMIDPPDYVEQFTYFMTQFCMVTMFSAGSQIIPIIVLFFNLLNIEGLLYGERKFVKRPLAEPKKIQDFGMTSYNLLVILVQFQIVQLFIKQINNSQIYQLELMKFGLRNFLLLIVAEHIVIGIKFVIEGVIPDEPQWVELVLKKEEYLSEQNKSNIKKNDQYIKPLENKIKQD
ncbi:unnamed protein product [Paramecium primaurelia]|uniref:Anoctamin transmembrane domain-containing protein n=1 Tax=Paramecium primaurelia TaxID=5886 RepID=A0A8S1L6X6_PARPR|nr:unnamed protein product [Paramecium primaurelia]